MPTPSRPFASWAFWISLSNIPSVTALPPSFSSGIPSPYPGCKPWGLAFFAGVGARVGLRDRRKSARDWD